MSLYSEVLLENGKQLSSTAFSMQKTKKQKKHTQEKEKVWEGRKGKRNGGKEGGRDEGASKDRMSQIE